MDSPLILLLCLFSTLLQFTSGYILTLPNKTDDQSHHFNWKFSTNHPFQYFPSVQSIPHNYLPIQVSSIFDRQGVYVLRHKDFLGAPKFFSDSSRAKSSETTATIQFQTSSQLFETVTIKILAYGTTDFQVKFPESLKTGFPILEPAYLKNCTGSSGSPAVEELDGPPKWISFKIQTPPTSHLLLEAVIRYTHAFLIIDEVIIDFGEGASKNHHADNIKVSTKTNIFCDINLHN